ncbi:MAG TPA: DUF975 family protein [Clostridia bacterium]|nr:DUF975 family protein [Clostridia bacterium]
MWTRAQLKANAKTALKTRYGIAIVVSLLAGMLSGSSPSLGTSVFTGTFNAGSGDVEKMKDFFTTNAEVSGVLLILFFLAAASGVIFGIFVSAPIAVGQDRFYLQNRLGQGDIGTLFSGFQPGYLNVVKVVFLKNLYIFLWSLLFVIPGIIKTYEYHMVEYILAENPHMDSARALEISREMMRGHKLDTFILRLSFFGWSILSVMSCGIGFLFLMPYIQATFAELYTALREKAIAEGTVTFEELTGVRAF